MTKLFLVGFAPIESDAIDRFFDARRDKPPGWQRAQQVQEADVFIVYARDRAPGTEAQTRQSPVSQSPVRHRHNQAHHA